MRRSVAGVVGAPLLILGLLSQHPLAMIGIAGTGLLLVLHAATGAGPKPFLPLALELLILLLLGAVAAGTVGLVAYYFV